MTKDDSQPTFKSVFGEQWEHLPIVMRKHYANRPYSNDLVTVKGKMNIDCTGMMNWLLPLFKFFNVLVPYKGKNIPVTMCLRSHLDSPALYFDRTFYIPHKPFCYFRSYMMPIKDNTVVEFVFLGIGWRTTYVYEENKVILKYNGYVWKLFGYLVPLPLSWIFGKMQLEKEAISDDAFRLKMEMIHPLFGKYLYTGEFNII